ncbi:H2O-forming NADH oxidase [Candidatus Arthromitus sp. SFB-rat-Yit]|uniref:H2O-forming NADH oxidase n=1 Tax=Candidatus Arthromitus sp. SFB-rat-Yit TaxID=1041504 RepID=UPI0002E2BC10|nr:FAD-dependent oxidoreductase [Candidatus Arthromitus sp. SFB-rat-Yit]
MSKIVFVGSNHAGTAAINTVLDNYKDNEVVVFDRNSNISFLGCGMALWIGNVIDGPEGLFYSSKDKMEAKGAKVHMETEIEDIDFENKIITGKNKNGEEIKESYDKLILATGSLPISPNIPGKDLENVQFVKLYQDAAQTIERLKNPDIKKITVIGAGYIGVELAEAFKRHGKSVTLLDLASTCLERYYDEPFTKMMEQNLLDNGIDLRFGEKVVELKGNGKVEKVVTDKGEIDTDMVVLAIGFLPNTSIGKGKIETIGNGAFKVNLKGETSVKDVYAIGDCATIYDNSKDQTSYIALASNAVRTGIVAAHNACGTELESIGVQGSNGISIYGLNMVSTGLTVNTAKMFGFDPEYTEYEDSQKPAFMKHDNNNVKVRIVYDKKTRRVLGAQMASKQDISMGIHMFSLAIQEKVTIDKLRLLDLFFLPHFNQPYNYITMAALTAK